MYKCIHMCLCVYRHSSKTYMGWKIPETATNNWYGGQEKKVPPFPGLPQPPQLCQRQWQEAKGKERDRGGEPNQAGRPLFHTGSTETQELKSFFMNLYLDQKGLCRLRSQAMPMGLRADLRLQISSSPADFSGWG